MFEHKRTALVIGATGGIGRAVAEALAAHGWNIRALHRDPERASAGKPDLSIRSFPWIAVYLASPFSPFMRELREMRYLWRLPIKLDNSKLVSRLGEEPHTPLDEAVAQTLASMGPLPN